MRFQAKNSYWYTPDIDNNLSLPPAKQLKARILRPDPETKEELTIVQVTRDFSKQEVESLRSGNLPGTDEPKKATTTIRRQQDTGRILREHVPELVNTEVELIDDDGKSTIQMIKSGAELSVSKAFGIDRLVELLCAEVLRDKLPEKKEKNSEPASSSS